ncbi:MAG: hypothetical protein A2Z88_04010 [Omnitrophica WOR_2 bacterium GWA2_47_8]|nr:MAG: hypothetical protein A2Z88_04010 [Omnitrophica WOR_2 bacterium GWA2_47_8]
MSFLNQFFQTFFHYAHELWWSLLLGFLLSGIVYEFIPTRVIEKYLSQKGLRPILLTSLIGTALPICCFGTLPVAITLLQKGARLGPVFAFLVTTPATSISALIVCYKLLGIYFTVYIFFAVIIMGLLMGMIGNFFHVPVPAKGEDGQVKGSCCSRDAVSQEKPFNEKIKGALYYAFVTLPKEIGLELLLGVIVASVIVIADPVKAVVSGYLSGALGYFVIIVSGLVTYVCSTASVPLADALLKSGMTAGHVMTFLLVGPITSYGTLLVINKEFGGKILFIYIVCISLLSLLLGILFNWVAVFSLIPS